MKQVVILGATGSIGKQTVEIICRHPQSFALIGVAARDSVDDILALMDDHPIRYVSLDKHHKHAVRAADQDVLFYHTPTQLIDAVSEDVIVVNALVGSAGLEPTLRAIQKGFDLMLANKEALVVGGALIRPLLKKTTSKLIPIDSEHSALSQCLKGSKLEDVERAIITASGGSFRDLDRAQLKNVSVKDALKHPNWTMGAKVTIDSATMMNKVFEVVEAHYLFDFPYEKVTAVLHEESIVHALVYYKDGNMLAHLGPSDMRIPILTALAGSKRLSYDTNFDITKTKALHFKALDETRYPLFKIGLACAQEGQGRLVTLNAANEMAVALFLEEIITFLEIETIIKECLETFTEPIEMTLDAVLKHDATVKRHVRDTYGR